MNYDNFAQALLAVFYTLTAENWTSLMYNLSDGYNPFFVKFYFTMIVIIGHYYML